MSGFGRGLKRGGENGISFITFKSSSSGTLRVYRVNDIVPYTID